LVEYPFDESSVELLLLAPLLASVDKGGVMTVAPVCCCCDDACWVCCCPGFCFLSFSSLRHFARRLLNHT
jgi:hypothetical protein